MSDHKLIPLSRGQITIVDAEDYDRLSQFKWHADWREDMGSFYAQGWVTLPDGKKVKIRMHRFLLSPSSSSQVVDHINGNTLDNRRSNLRLVDAFENAQNKKRLATNKTGFKGVSRFRETQFQAHICHRGERVYLGIFDTAEDAYMAYLDAAKRLHGEFARLETA